MLRPWSGLLAMATLLLVAPQGTAQRVSPVPPEPSPSQAASPSPITVDVVVLDRDGRPVDTLTSNDFTVTVDGRPRRVAALKHVSRGPGANAAAAAVAARAAAITAAAEPVRSVLIVVDQTLLERGDEAATVRAAAALLDRLGLSDRVAIVPVPNPARTAINLTTDRPSAREELRSVAGQASAASAADDAARVDQPARDDAARVTGGDPDKAAVGERELLPSTAIDVPRSVSPEMQARVRDSVGGLRDLLVSVGRVPGRKAVVLFSAGLPRGWNDLVRDGDLRNLAAAASAARATVHVIGLRVTHGDASLAPELSPFETLARYTGGTATMLDKQVDRTIERVMPSLASCYVLSLEPAETDGDGKLHALKVETTRRGLVVQSPASLVPTSDPDDAVVALPPTRPDNAAPTPAAPTAGAKAPPATPSSSATSEELRDSKASREAEAALLLSKALDYVAGYQRALSAVVAEETYIQVAGTRRVSLVSDLLLVRPANGETWVCFRDVFEVNGEKVRDRESRLNALFLANPNVNESDQLRAIKAESARYNIGAVERNLNVPLYALRVLTPENRARFRFSLGKAGQAGGVSVQRIEFEEVARPTIVGDALNTVNVPLRGSFAIDPLTGAVIASTIEAEHPRLNARYDVRYRRDPDLGLWVPEQMSEMYLGVSATRIAEGQATYKKFRRFQVKVEEKVTIPK